MTGKHLHEEQMLLREKLRKTSAPTQVKEVRLSGNIAKHDLEVKQRHVQGWLKEGETHVHVRVTVMGKGKGQKKITKEQQVREMLFWKQSGYRLTWILCIQVYESKPRLVGK